MFFLGDRHACWLFFIGLHLLFFSLATNYNFKCRFLCLTVCVIFMNISYSFMEITYHDSVVQNSCGIRNFQLSNIVGFIEGEIQVVLEYGIRFNQLLC